MENTIKLAFVGDIMPSGVLYGREEDSIDIKVIQELSKADIRIGNLECAMSVYCEKPHFDPVKMSKLMDVVWAIDEDIERVKRMGFDVLCLANNHIFDLGKEGLQHTIDLLSKNGLRYCGAGMNLDEASKPVVIEKNEKTIAIISCCDYREETVGYVPFATEKEPGVNPLYPIEHTCSEIIRYKKFYDYVFVVPHWGVEHTWWATDIVLKDSRMMIDAGADAVIGGHPHRIQTSYYYKSHPIFPSLGNFFFPDRWLNDPRPTWYPPKGTDTSNYPREDGFPWVKEPTVKTWSHFGRIGMIAHLSLENQIIKNDVSYVLMDENNYLQKVNSLKDVLPRKDVIILAFSGILYKFHFVYDTTQLIMKKYKNLMRAIRKTARRLLQRNSALCSVFVSLLAFIKYGGVNL